VMRLRPPDFALRPDLRPACFVKLVNSHSFFLLAHSFDADSTQWNRDWRKGCFRQTSESTAGRPTDMATPLP